MMPEAVELSRQMVHVLGHATQLRVVVLRDRAIRNGLIAPLGQPFHCRHDRAGALPGGSAGARSLSTSNAWME